MPQEINDRIQELLSITGEPVELYEREKLWRSHSIRVRFNVERTNAWAAVEEVILRGDILVIVDQEHNREFRYKVISIDFDRAHYIQKLTLQSQG